jgi:cell division protein FtsB
MARVPGGPREESSAPAAERERRYIYNGAPTARSAGYALRPNRKAIRRKVSTFNIILLLFGIGGAIVFSISNIIAINQLSLEVEQSRQTLKRITNTNNALRSDVDGKSAPDKLMPIAASQLGLHPPLRPAVWFSIDWDKARALGVRPARER